VTCQIALRHELRNIWRLPEERWFSYTGPEWLLHLLASVDKDAQEKTFASMACMAPPEQYHAWQRKGDRE
jgi:hypothetical protein